MNDYLLENQETERLFFRKLVSADFDLWLRFHEDKKTSQFWHGLPENPQVACEQDFEHTFHRYLNNLGGKQSLILKNTNTLVGLAGLLIQEVDGAQELEIAYSLLPEYWGYGYASEAAEKCREYAFQNLLAKSLISIIQVNNIASQKVALNIGMELDKTVMYNKNQVHIFRISHTH